MSNKQKDQYGHLLNKHLQYHTSHILIQQISQKIQQRQNKPPIKIKQMTVILPGYLRMKFKNFVALDLQNLGGQMNATMIFSIYYGQLIQYLKQAYKIGQKQQDELLKKMQNQFIINFSKDDAIKLSQGKKQKKLRNKSQQSRINFNNFNLQEDQKSNLKQTNPDKQQKQNNQKQKVKRNIQTTIKLDKKKQLVNFTIRKNFTIRLNSYVFYTPFQIIISMLQITIQSLKGIQLKTPQGAIKLNLQINLLNTQNNSVKISISESKKFGQYGLILPDLNANYYNKKIQDQDEYYVKFIRKFWSKTVSQQQQLLTKQVQRAFSDPKYIHYRSAYRKLYSNHPQYPKLGQLFKNKFSQNKYQQQESQYYKNNPIQKVRKFKDQNKFETFKYANFKIPVYKFPFTPLATIFLPLILLAILNLGIFFQDDNLAERIGSIASLMIAFIAFIPTIRAQIPPSPSIVFVEVLIYLVAATSMLALGQSLKIALSEDFLQFWHWQQDILFMISLIIDIVVFVIVTLELIIHYCVLQKRYKSQPQNSGRQGFKRQNWSNKESESMINNIYDYKILRQNKKNGNKIYGITNKKIGTKQKANKDFKNLDKRMNEQARLIQIQQSNMNKNNNSNKVHYDIQNANEIILNRKININQQIQNTQEILQNSIQTSYHRLHPNQQPNSHI